MSKVVWKGGALIAPLPPVMVTCAERITAEDGTQTTRDNIITIAWTGITCTNPPKTYISVRPGRFSHHILCETKEFVINLATASMAKSVDYCGIYTGAKVDKFEKCGFTKEKSEVVGCPSIAECPMAIECRVTDIIAQGSHDMFLADIVAVRVDEKLLDEKGKLELAGAGLLAFAHGEYFKLGEKVGDFGFSARREHKKGTGKGFEKFAEKTAKGSKHNAVKEYLDDDDFDADELWGDDVEVVEIIVPQDKASKKKAYDKKSAHKRTEYKPERSKREKDGKSFRPENKTGGKYTKDGYHGARNQKSPGEFSKNKKFDDRKGAKDSGKYSKSKPHYEKETKVTKSQKSKHKK